MMKYNTRAMSKSAFLKQDSHLIHRTQKMMLTIFSIFPKIGHNYSILDA